MERRYEDTAQLAENYRAEAVMWRERWADLLRQESALEAQRPVVEESVVERLMTQTNPKTGRPHSASSAGEAAKVDPEYLAHLLNQRNVVHAKNTARTKAKSARFQAQIALTQMKAHAGVI